MRNPDQNGPELREREAIGDRGRGELADAEVEVAARAVRRREVSGSVEAEMRLRRGREVGRAADEPGDALRDRVQHLARGVARGEALRVRGERGEPRVPVLGKRSALHALDLVGELREGCAVFLEPRLPRRSRLAATGADALREVLDDTVGDEELGVLGPAVEPLRLLHALGTERLSVRLRCVLDGRAVADVAVHEDQRRPLVLRLENLERALGRLEVVRVGDRRHVPAVRGEARRDVLREREVRVALDRDAVRVVDPAEIREALVRRERRRLGRDAFHHAAVAGLGVHVEVEEREPVAVVARPQPLARDRHSHRCRDSLSERAGRRLDAARPAVLGVAGALRPELAEALEVVERDGRLAEDLVLGVDRFDAGEIQQRPQQRGRVSRREHEAVPVRPDRVGRVEAQKSLPERVRDGGDADRRSRMTRVRCLDRVDAERSDRRDAELVEVARHAAGSPSSNPCVHAVSRRSAAMGPSSLRSHE